MKHVEQLVAPASPSAHRTAGRGVAHSNRASSGDGGRRLEAPGALGRRRAAFLSATCVPVLPPGDSNPACSATAPPPQAARRHAGVHGANVACSGSVQARKGIAFDRQRLVFRSRHGSESAAPITHRRVAARDRAVRRAGTSGCCPARRPSGDTSRGSAMHKPTGLARPCPKHGSGAHARVRRRRRASNGSTLDAGAARAQVVHRVS